MISLRLEPLLSRLDRRHNLSPSLVEMLCLNSGCYRTSSFSLLIRVGKNGRAVLCTGIVPLAVFGRGVVGSVEKFCVPWY